MLDTQKVERKTIERAIEKGAEYRNAVLSGNRKKSAIALHVFVRSISQVIAECDVSKKSN